jgi:hypothetical protein
MPPAEDTSVEELLAAGRTAAETCSHPVMKCYLHYELQSIDDQLSHLKCRLREILSSDHRTNARRAKELRRDNFVFIRYLMIKELLGGGYRDHGTEISTTDRNVNTTDRNHSPQEPGRV